ncbi:response regulator [Nakamurella sp. YIM 132084]|uniref:Transcriptional regulatory protein n=1 Tax=Nakamurella leprariae TaxID=2803911 RepID=A0A938Y824_9ACTN|nr:response regulator [Nakamurella leprariae]
MRVLVVEDEPIASRAHQAYVGRIDGFRVVGAAASARDAERRLRGAAGEPVDLVLLDLHLPDGHGLELLRRVRAAGSTVDVMVVSSARDAEVVRSAVAQGAVQYVLKPFTAAALRDRLLAYRRFRDQVVEPAGSGALDQVAVDAALSALRTAGTGSALPKGLTAPTLAVVAAALRAAGEGSAQELATRLDVSRITARRYLEHLVDTGAAERTLRYGQVGRPETRYRSVRG